MTPQNPTNEFQIVEAKKESALVMAIFEGVAWSGKTLSALLFAQGLCPTDKRIGVIDTETRASRDYADKMDYVVIDLNPPFTPARYKMAIEALMNQVPNIGVLVIDSLTHEWSGIGGILEGKTVSDGKLVEKYGEKANTWGNWNKWKSVHNTFIEWLKSIPIHKICTVRAKTHWDVTGGKPRKVGLEPKQSDELEFEFNIELMLNRDDHRFKSSKIDMEFLKMET